MFHSCAVSTNWRSSQGELKEAIVCAGGYNVKTKQALDSIEVWYFRDYLANKADVPWIKLNVKLTSVIVIAKVHTKSAIISLLQARIGLTLVTVQKYTFAIGGMSSNGQMSKSEIILNDELVKSTKPDQQTTLPLIAFPIIMNGIEEKRNKQPLGTNAINKKKSVVVGSLLNNKGM